MSDFNQVILIGHLCFQPELSYTPQGTAFAKFRLGVNYTAVRKDGTKFDDTLFIDLTAWTKLAEVVATHLTKGSRVMVQGRLKLDKWTTKDGQARSKHSIQASKVIFLDKSGETKSVSEESADEDKIEDTAANRASSIPPEENQPSQETGAEVSDEEIPF